MKVSSRPAAPTPTPENPAEVADTATGTLPPTTQAPLPPTPAKGQLRSSGFFQAFDLLLAAGVVLLGFTVSVFVIRNSEFWLHLGTGRLIAQGEYQFGQAPFSYVGQDRAYTDHSWLFDFGLYTAYRVGGGHGAAVVVSLKAVAMAALALLLLFVRKRGNSLWFSVFTVGLALFASAPELIVQPLLVSFLFFAATLFLLTQEVKRLPVAIGILFALWANLDAWFFIGPLTVALYLVGGIVQSSLLPTDHEEAPGKTRRLAIALGVGCLACMVNPHHVRIWELPPEIASRQLTQLFGNDRELGYLFQGPFGEMGLDFSGDEGGNPVNAYAFVGLMVITLVGIGLNIRRISIGLTLIAFAMLVFAFYRTRAIPFFAIVAAPLAAMNLAAFAQRCKEKEYSTGVLSLLNVGRYGIRIVTLFVGLAALTASWAGWLQPLSEQRRLAWGAEIDESLKQTAEEIQHWRTRAENPLAPTAHGLMMQTDLAHYCAWFAPAEKTFFDARLRFHAPEAEAFQLARRHLVPTNQRDDSLRADFIPKFFTEHKIVYLAEGSTNRSENLAFLKKRWEAGPVDASWMNWSFHGRTVILGWKAQTTIPSAMFDLQRFDAVNVAFGPDAKPVIGSLDPSQSAPLPRKSLIERFLFAPPPASPEADEALLYVTWLGVENQRHIIAFIAIHEKLLEAQYTLNPQFVIVPRGPDQPAPELTATAILAVRAARRAILASPQNAEGYLALAKAYEAPFSATPVQEMGLNPDIQSMSYERFFSRTTPEEQRTRGYVNVIADAMNIAVLHQQRSDQEHPRRSEEEQPKISDLYIDSLKRALTYLRLMKITSLPNMTAAQIADNRKDIENRITELDKRLKLQSDIYLGEAQQVKSQVTRGQIARKSQALYAKSLEELQKFNSEDPKISTEEKLSWITEITELLVIFGQIEEAYQRIDQGDEIFKFYDGYLQRRFDNQISVQQQQILQQRLQPLLDRWGRTRIRVYLAQGDFQRSTQLMLSEAVQYRDSFPKLKQDYEKYQVAVFLKRLSLEFIRDVDVHIGAYHGVIRPVIDFRDDSASRSLLGIDQAINTMAQMHMQLGLIYLEQGDNAAAKVQFEEAIRPFGVDAPHRLRRRAEYFAGLLKAG